MNRVLSQTGLTLIEVIMTLVLFGLVAVMTVSFFSSGVTRTDVPITQLQADAQLQLVLENMIADTASSSSANNNLQTFANNLGAVGSTQSAFGNTGSYYIVGKSFVCPNVSNGFEANGTAKQFLLVTISSNASSGTNLSYLFSTNAAAVNCAAGGS